MNFVLHGQLIKTFIYKKKKQFLCNLLNYFEAGYFFVE